MKFYSQSTKGFYDESIHGKRMLVVIDPSFQPSEGNQNLEEVHYIEVENPYCLIPLDAMEISEEQHQALLEGQSKGKIIDSVDGYPVLVEPPPLSENEQIKLQIRNIESTITERSLREAILGIDNGNLKNLNDQIAELRTHFIPE